MIEAGAEEVPEDMLLEAFDLAQAEIRKLCEAQEELRRDVGKAKWLDPEVTDELEREHGDRIGRAHRRRRPARGAANVVEELATELGPELRMDSTEEDIIRQTQVRASLNVRARAAAPGRRRGPGARAVRRRPARRSPRPSRTRRSSSRPSGTCSSTASSRASSCRSRSARRPSTATRRW